MPGGGIPIGAPRPGGIPIGGPMGGLMPGGGGAPLLMGGGGPPRPVAAAAAAATRLTCWDGPPTPLTGPANPAGACGMGAPAGTPLPAALPTPGPPAAPASGTRMSLSFLLASAPILLTSFGGGPSTVMDTRFSPRSNTRPRTRFSSRSGCFEFLGLSQRMRFMCLSKALKVPMKTRPSCRMHRMR
uniref:Uncharacterized protein n=1 Tax=Calidris pygmaea TaxID=425635 RepID=A0A8C3PK18_9CHAR